MPRGRSFRDQQQLVNAANRWTELMYGDIRAAKGIAPMVLPEIKAKRAPRKPSGEISEAAILKAIMALLKRHPKVARVWRQNSGTFREGNRWIRANSARGMADIMGVLKDGRTLAIEVKSRLGIVHAHQHEFLNSISTAGGIAFVARSIDDVLNKLREL